MKKFIQKIKCFLGFHNLKAIYTRKTGWNKIGQKYTIEYKVFKCKNCKTEKEKKYEI